MIIKVSFCFLRDNSQSKIPNLSKPALGYSYNVNSAYVALARSPSNTMIAQHLLRISVGLGNKGTYFPRFIRIFYKRTQPPSRLFACREDPPLWRKSANAPWSFYSIPIDHVGCTNVRDTNMDEYRKSAGLPRHFALSRPHRTNAASHTDNHRIVFSLSHMVVGTI